MRQLVPLLRKQKMLEISQCSNCVENAEPQKGQSNMASVNCFSQSRLDTKHWGLLILCCQYRHVFLCPCPSQYRLSVLKGLPEVSVSFPITCLQHLWHQEQLGWQHGASPRLWHLDLLHNAWPHFAAAAEGGGPTGKDCGPTGEPQGVCADGW